MSKKRILTFKREKVFPDAQKQFNARDKLLMSLFLCVFTCDGNQFWKLLYMYSINVKEVR